MRTFTPLGQGSVWLVAVRRPKEEEEEEGEHVGHGIIKGDPMLCACTSELQQSTTALPPRALTGVLLSWWDLGGTPVLIDLEENGGRGKFEG